MNKGRGWTATAGLGILALLLLGLTGCPVLSDPALLAFTATPNTGTPDLTVQFHGVLIPLPPYQLTKFRGEGPEEPCDQCVQIEVVEWVWDFGDCCSPLGSGPTPIHTYTEPGCYTITVSVTFSDGSVVTRQEPCYITVTPAKNADDAAVDTPT
jgi:PKD repeat protein